MYAWRIDTIKYGEQQCEECGRSSTTVWGIVSKMDIEGIQDGSLTSRSAAEWLLWEDGIGEISCKECLEKRIKGGKKCPA